MTQIFRAEEAIKKIIEKTKTIECFELISFSQGLGRVCAKNVACPIDVPRHKNSAMDGYAINLNTAKEQQATVSLWDRRPDKIKVIGSATAGHPFSGKSSSDSAIQVMTGAIIPAGYDTVVIKEDVSITNGCINIKEFPERGANIREAGEDLQKGETCITQKHKLTAADLGLLASIGTGDIKVYKRPKVTILSTGDEIKNPNENLLPGQIYDSNRFSLTGMLQKVGMEINDLGIVPDDQITLRKTLIEAAMESDVMITTGGVSVGEKDYIKTILEEIGKIFFWKIKIKPGRPFTFGKIGESLYFGLPGNPVSTMITFSQFVLPSLSKLSGCIPKKPFLIKAKATTSIRKVKGRTEYQRGFFEIKDYNSFAVTPANNQGSGVLNSMSRANCLIHLPDNCGQVEKEQEVFIEPFETNPVLC